MAERFPFHPVCPRKKRIDWPFCGLRPLRMPLSLVLDRPTQSVRLFNGRAGVRGPPPRAEAVEILTALAAEADVADEVVVAPAVRAVSAAEAAEVLPEEAGIM